MIAFHPESGGARPAFLVRQARHLGMCFGVRDAIDLALHESHSGPLTILGDLVHNESVVARLRASGAVIEHRVEAVAGPRVMITAHGASERKIAEVREHGLQVIEATCPLVHYAHRAVQRLVKDGFHPVIVGKRDHVEVRGITEDLQEYDVILTEADVQSLPERPRFGVAAQTTQPVERVRALVDLMRRRFPASEIRVVDTVCQPTKQRQRAAIELSRASDVVVVIGGANSNNTRELVATCSQHCYRVHHVQTADDLRPEWFAGAGEIGVTAGTSTPDEIISAVVQRLERIAVECGMAVEPLNASAVHEHALASHAS
jgi:4-hydroxy-3-methylbut-2-enyl diphosphate reductase